MKWALCAVAVFACGAARAQQPAETPQPDLLKGVDSLDLSAPAKKAAPAAGDAAKKTAAKAGDQNKGPTEITSTKEATFDNKTHQAVFIGNVHVKDPEFTITCQKLTAFLRDTGGEKSASPAPKPRTIPSPTPSAAKTNDDNGPGGGLDRAVAEGNVVIVQEKPGENGGPPKRYIGKAERADYDAATGDVKLTGWPQIQQGINTQIATEASTVMIMNRDGRMKTQGGSKTVIQEETE